MTFSSNLQYFSDRILDPHAVEHAKTKEFLPPFVVRILAADLVEHACWYSVPSFRRELFLVDSSLRQTSWWLLRAIRKI